MNRDELDSWACRTASWDLAGESGAVALARDHVAGFLADAARPVSAAVAQDVRVAVSELVTNAVLYAPGPIVLELTDDGPALTITVGDTSEVEPRQREPDLIAGTGGLGLRVLAAMGARLDVRPRAGGGKIVAAWLPCPGR